MSNSLFGLWHHPIICSYHQNDNVSSLSTSSPHGCECCMAGSIKKCDQMSIVFCLVSSNMLGDSTYLPLSDICLSDSIQQGCLAVIHMTKNGNYRWTRCQIFGGFFCNDFPPLGYFTQILFDFFRTLGDGLKTHLRCDDCGGIKIYWLINTCHDAIRHQCFNHIDRAGLHDASKLTHSYTG